MYSVGTSSKRGNHTPCTQPYPPRIGCNKLPHVQAGFFQQVLVLHYALLFHFYPLPLSSPPFHIHLTLKDITSM